MITGGGGVFTPAAFAVGGIPRSSDFVDIYANQVRLSVTVSDISIMFSTIQDRGPGVITPEDRASIRLSPMTAKAFLKNLEMVVAAYEAVLGEIPVPPKASKMIDEYYDGLTNMLAEQMAPPPQDDNATSS